MLDDLHFMRLAFDEARQATGNTSPNPLVGCIIVKDGKIISKGYHRKAGVPHAELDAIQNAKESIEGAIIYCNLEPCCHLNKRTPPCAQRLIQEKVKKVVIANLDPNPEVAGRGVELLKEAGIEVVTGVLKEEGEVLNEIFFTHITQRRPFIELKFAQTLNGKTATAPDVSKWITGPKAREHVHFERLKYDAILVGANTIRVDNPHLTVRIEDKIISKKRIILSLSGNLPKDSRVFTDSYKEQTILVLPESTKTDINTDIIYCPLKEDKFDLDWLLKALYEKGITSLYIEGGRAVIESFLEKDLYDRLSIYIAPKLQSFGEVIKGQLEFENPKFLILDQDIYFTARRGK